MMSPSGIATDSVLERFPDQWHVIVDLCRTNDDFRELCDHYAECVNVLNRLRGDASAEEPRAREYQDLVEALESEIRLMLGRVS